MVKVAALALAAREAARSSSRGIEAAIDASFFFLVVPYSMLDRLASCLGCLGGSRRVFIGVGWPPGNDEG